MQKNNNQQFTSEVKTHETALLNMKSARLEEISTLSSKIIEMSKKHDKGYQGYKLELWSIKEISKPANRELYIQTIDSLVGLLSSEYTGTILGQEFCHETTGIIYQAKNVIEKNTLFSGIDGPSKVEASDYLDLSKEIEKINAQCSAINKQLKLARDKLVVDDSNVQPKSEERLKEAVEESKEKIEAIEERKQTIDEFEGKYKDLQDKLDNKRKENDNMLREYSNLSDLQYETYRLSSVTKAGRYIRARGRLFNIDTHSFANKEKILQIVNIDNFPDNFDKDAIKIQLAKLDELLKDELAPLQEKVENYNSEVSSVHIDKEKVLNEYIEYLKKEIEEVEKDGVKDGEKGGIEGLYNKLIEQNSSLHEMKHNQFNSLLQMKELLRRDQNNVINCSIEDLNILKDLLLYDYTQDLLGAEHCKEASDIVSEHINQIPELHTVK